MKVSLCVGNVQSIIVNKSDARVLGVGCCLSVVFYAFYLKMGCPRLKVIKCSQV